jgi:hypothetical protein
VTGRLELRYPQPLQLGVGAFRVEARAERPLGRMVRVEGVIVGADGNPAVEAKTLFIVLE